MFSAHRTKDKAKGPLSNFSLGDRGSMSQPLTPIPHSVPIPLIPASASTPPTHFIPAKQLDFLQKQGQRRGGDQQSLF